MFFTSKWKKNDSIFRMTIKTGLYTLNLIWEMQLRRPPENSSSMGQRTGLSMSTLTSRDVLILPSTDTRGTRERGTRKKATNKREKTKLLTVTDSVFILVWFLNWIPTISRPQSQICLTQLYAWFILYKSPNPTTSPNASTIQPQNTKSYTTKTPFILCVYSRYTM